MKLIRKILSCKFFIYLFFYFFVNLFFLTHFPFIHSDEAWLSGLSRAWMEEGSIAVSEPFFDLYPRSPHAIKILFHSAQIGIFILFGYGIFQARLLSLLFALASLLLFRRVLEQIFGAEISPPMKEGLAIALSIDPWFLSVAHTGRQEICLFFFLLLAISILSSRLSPGGRKSAGAGIAIGLAIGFHPAAFLLSGVIGAAILFGRSTEDLSPPRRFRNLGIYALVCGTFALLFIGISVAINPDFFSGYATFGRSLELYLPWYIRVFRYPDYLQKIWYRHSGTYFIPEYRLQILFFITLGGLSLLEIGKSGSRGHWLIPAWIAFQLFLVILGKFAAPLFVLQLPLLYLLVGDTLRKRRRTWLLPLLLSLSLANTLFTIAPYLDPEREHYSDYSRKIDKALSGEEEAYRLLANLNSEYALDYGSFLDYRNLAYLETSGISFTQYIRDRRITHILYSDEMDLIYQRRPVWNILYGNVAGYYREMKEYIHKNAVPAARFASPVYGMRIQAYSGKRNSFVTLYRLQDAGEGSAASSRPVPTQDSGEQNRRAQNVQ